MAISQDDMFGTQDGKSHVHHGYCSVSLNGYACNPEESRGRLVPEKESTRRTAFERDRDRIIHSRAFRRLKNKTQVFAYTQGDHYRTRLSHSIEVAQIARSLCRSLKLNEDLAETIGLAHDLGHTPFAHLGEDGLREALQEHGAWFNHNEQTFRIITKLEKQYALFDGLNLTWETLEGIVKHNGPLQYQKDPKPPQTILDFNEKMDLMLNGFPSAEAQVAAIADDIAYNNHDLDDGLRAGMFTLDDMKSIPLAAKAIDAVDRRYTGMTDKVYRAEIIREMIGMMVDDLIQESRSRLKRINPQTADDIRNCGEAVIGFSQEMQDHEQRLRKFLWKNMYRHYTVNRARVKYKKLIRDLLDYFMENPECLPDDWQPYIAKEGKERVIIDYIAGMTDRYALEEHKKLFGYDD